MLISDTEKKELENLVAKMKELGIKRLERNGFEIELEPAVVWTEWFEKYAKQMRPIK